MKAEIYDDRHCELGEGAFWHPQRRQFFWFDILGRKLLSRAGDAPLEWRFERNVSAAGWIDDERLLIAGAGALVNFDIGTGRSEPICALEADRPDLRSNDGRADPFGGFWIGVMGRKAETGAGGIWRYFRGQMRRLYDGITIPNAICFTPDGGFAHFADTREAKVWRVRLDSSGWPMGEPELFLDLRRQGLNPDGAVCDTEGNLWLARWGSGTVGCYAPDGREIATVAVPASQVSCPAFGGADLNLLHVTTASEGLGAPALARDPQAGKTFICRTKARGQPEHRVVL